MFGYLGGEYSKHLVSYRKDIVMEYWQQQLHERYPLTFHQKPYFACGQGWAGILEELAKKIEPALAADPTAEWTILDVKSKFAALRFYYRTDCSGVNDLWVMGAEEQSLHTCEQCGQPGKRRGKGWIYTACDNHTEEEDK
jgi:hypothetical protein